MSVPPSALAAGVRACTPPLGTVTQSCVVHRCLIEAHLTIYPCSLAFQVYIHLCQPNNQDLSPHSMLSEIRPLLRHSEDYERIHTCLGCWVCCSSRLFGVLRAVSRAFLSYLSTCRHWLLSYFTISSHTPAELTIM